MPAAPIPLFDMQSQLARLAPEIHDRVRGVLERGQYVLGPEVSELETRLAGIAGVAHAVTVANGTDALQIGLMAEGIGPGDAVFVPSFTYVATAGAVVAVGATPVFCEVDPATFGLDPADLARRIGTLPDGLRARAVIPVDLFGQPADYPAITAVAAKHGLFVMADAAQSLGAALNGVAVGALAPVSATSFYPTKPLGCFGDGGALFTDDDETAARMRSIRFHGGGGVHDGLNSRLDTVQAAILLSKLDLFEVDRTRRATVAALYDSAFAGHVGLQGGLPGADSAYAVYAILTERRDALKAALDAQGIASRAYYATPVHLMPAMLRHSEGEGSLPVTERLSAQILALPIHGDLSDEAAARVCEAVLDGLGQAGGTAQARGAV